MAKFELKNGDILVTGYINNIKLRTVGQNKDKIMGTASIKFGKGENGESLYINIACFSPLTPVLASIPNYSSVIVGGRKDVFVGNDGVERVRIVADFICPAVAGKAIHFPDENEQSSDVPEKSLDLDNNEPF